ncbi:AAA family ATPase [Sorangium sp. So ce185]|uniref:AAA family ATPase n=1 Tax=Sorangium sp. So ce185 TaxID=3133287 RepID=UPI003F5D600C
MPTFINIRHLDVEGLHGNQRLTVDFQPGLNIFHGKNGHGKTTMLHIVANLLERDIERFCHIVFRRLVAEMDNGAKLELRQTPSSDGARVEVLVDGAASGFVRRGEITPLPLNALLRERLGGRPVYLPAFRSVLEAITRTTFTQGHVSSDFEKSETARIIELVTQEFRSDPEQRKIPYMMLRSRGESLAQKTILCRRWFGPFVPLVRYPSLWEVADEVAHEVQDAYLELSATDQKALSSVFVNVLGAVLGSDSDEDRESVPQLLSRVKHHLEALDPGNNEVAEIYSQLGSTLKMHGADSTPEAKVSRILHVYEKALADRAETQKKAFERIRIFQESVNRFLEEEGRRLVLDVRASYKGRGLRSGSNLIELPGKRRANFNALSSGERHVVTLLFSATHMSSADGVVLIDEPELSLHVEWQRIILTELEKQASGRQIIACTHAPEVSADHLEVYFPLATVAWTPDASQLSDDIEDDDGAEGA